MSLTVKSIFLPEDTDVVEDLETHVQGLIRWGLLKRELTLANPSDIVLVYISADLIASPVFDLISDFIEDGSRVIPVQVKRTDLTTWGSLLKLKFINAVGRDVDDVGVELVGELRKVIQELTR